MSKERSVQAEIIMVDKTSKASSISMDIPVGGVPEGALFFVRKPDDDYLVSGIAPTTIATTHPLIIEAYKKDYNFLNNEIVVVVLTQSSLWAGSEYAKMLNGWTYSSWDSFFKSWVVVEDSGK